MFKRRETYECVERKYKALWWNISSLKGISLAYWLHKIKLEEEFNLVVQPQRLLNPRMKVVAKKEVLKLFEAEMRRFIPSHPISASS
jgi:hypothetical protein